MKILRNSEAQNIICPHIKITVNSAPGAYTYISPRCCVTNNCMMWNQTGEGEGYCIFTAGIRRRKIKQK